VRDDHVAWEAWLHVGEGDDGRDHVSQRFQRAAAAVDQMAAEKSHVAILPVNGWWRLRKHLSRCNSRIRYSLVVTIRTSPQAIDVYTPVAAQISVPITVG